MSIPGYYLWEVPGRSIQLSLDVVDRLQQDVIRGFGAVPRRGAEVGGILLGSVEAGTQTARVEDYQLIPIEYKRGPSYLLSEEDTEAFQSALNLARGSSGQEALKPIGFFRSHTRDNPRLGDEDLAVLSKYFPDPETVALLIRPFGTRPSMAGFYFRDHGRFQSGPPLLEFPFRRKDLAPEDGTPPADRPPARPVSMPLRRQSELERELPERPSMEQAAPERATPERAAPERVERVAERIPPPAPQEWPAERRRMRNLPVRELETPEPESPLEAAGYVPVVPEKKSKARSGWIWVPLSFIFLLMGVLLGFQSALTLHPTSKTGPDSDPYNTSLSVTQSGGDLQVKWDRQAYAIRAAQRAVLTIEDGTYSKPIDLDSGQLQNGSVVVYHRYSNQVRFRLQLFLRERDVLTETVEWKQ